jgi:hypothetical protein
MSDVCCELMYHQRKFIYDAGQQHLLPEKTCSPAKNT